MLRRWKTLAGSALPLALLCGCSANMVLSPGSNGSDEGAETVPAVHINGKVHGGAYPIQGATVVLTETQSNGVWTAASGAYVGTAKPLYVTTSDANGSFSFPDTGWTCDAGQHVYIEVVGGHTTASSNPNVVQVGVVGDCSADLGSKTAIDGVNVFLSEPSTVAAAYALRSFLSIHSGNLTGTASDGTATLGTTVPLVDITAPASNNAVPVNPSLNPASTATGAVQVSLASAFNTTGIYTDGTAFTTGGFDNDGATAGTAYSGNLLGTSLTYGGVPYTFGTANQADAVRGGSSVVISLPSGNFNTLNMLAAGVNGSQASQGFTVTYTDGTTTTFTQGISDWYAGAMSNYTGEAVALTTNHRNTASGQQDARQFNVYQYSFTVNKAKLVKSLTLPNNTNVVVLAVTATQNLPVCSGVRAGTALSCTAAGLTHAFQNAYNLVDQVTFGSTQTPSGVARATLPGNSTAIAPREMINTLGNILQECVDSAGGTAPSGYTVGTSRCGDLFYYTTPSSGTAPTNTLQAAINMATYPSANVSQLIQLKPRNVFFTPEIPQANSAQPFAFTMSIFYKGTGLGDTFSTPQDLALDVQDNLYLVYGGTTPTSSPAVVDELSSSGTGLFSTSLSSVANPKSIAVDNSGYVWVTDDTASTGGVTGLYTSVNATKTAALGTSYQTVKLPTVANTTKTTGLPAGLAFDASGNMLVARDSADGNATMLLYTGAPNYSVAQSFGVAYPLQRATVSSQGDFYAVGTNTSTSEFVSYGYVSCGPTVAPTASSISAKSGASLAVNNNNSSTGNYNAFIPSSGQVVSFLGGCSANNSTRASANGKTGLASTTPAGAVMDGSLNLYWNDASSGLIYTLAGAGSSTNLSNLTATSFAPCWYTGGACATTTSAAYQGMAVDSSGAMWFLSRGGSYGLVQTLGMAAPAWPLLASENSGVTVQ